MRRQDVFPVLTLPPQHFSQRRARLRRRGVGHGGMLPYSFPRIVLTPQNFL